MVYSIQGPQWTAESSGHRCGACIPATLQYSYHMWLERFPIPARPHGNGDVRKTQENFRLVLPQMLLPSRRVSESDGVRPAHTDEPGAILILLASHVPIAVVYPHHQACRNCVPTALRVSNSATRSGKTAPPTDFMHLQARLILSAVSKKWFVCPAEHSVLWSSRRILTTSTAVEQLNFKEGEGRQKETDGHGLALDLC